MKKVMKVIFLKLIFNFLKDYMNLIMIQVEKLVANLHDKTKYAMHIRSLKQALNLELVFIKVHRVIKFNQNSWLKPYVDMNTDFQKYFFKLMNNAVFGNPIENVRKQIY